MLQSSIYSIDTIWSGMKPGNNFVLPVNMDPTPVCILGRWSRWYPQILESSSTSLGRREKPLGSSGYKDIFISVQGMCRDRSNIF